MHNYLLTIAQKGLKGKKRSSFYLFLVCFLSVTFAVINVSITGSLNKSRRELRYDMYGEWNVAVYSQDSLAAKLKDNRIQEYGTALMYGNLLDDGKTVLTGIGTLDDSLRTLGRLEVEDGKFPAKDNEIAIEADVLSDLGYDYKLGQTITLRIMDKEAMEQQKKDMKKENVAADKEDMAADENNGNIIKGDITIEKGEGVIVKEYILCGVLREYTGLWNTGTGEVTLVGACVTENAAKEIGNPCFYQYFMSTEQEESHELFQQLKKDYENTVENTFAYGPLGKEEYHYFNLALILMITIVAVIVIYSIQLKEQMRSIQLFRTIGVTKKQLSVIAVYETMLILLPAAVGGIMIGSLSTFLLLQILMEQSVSAFYVSIPAGWIAGILMLWFGAVFGIRFLILCYSLRGRLSTQKKWLSWADGRQKNRKRLSLLLLSSVSMLAIIFCYLESLSPIYIDNSWSQLSSYDISPGTREDLITDDYIESIKSLPGTKTVVAWRQLSGTLEFPAMEHNPFCSLLTAQPFPWSDGEYEENGQKGLQCFVFGIAEENWDKFFQYAEGEIDRESFRKGESVLLYIPYNTETGVELDGKLYQDFGVASGDMITVTSYGLGELTEDGSGVMEIGNENMPYEKYQEPMAVSQVKAQVTGIITIDLLEEAYLNLSPSYYTVIASNAFAKKLTEADRDGIWLENGIWSNQEYGYNLASVYTGMDAEYFSTDYLMAKLTAKNHLEFSNHREENTAYRQEAIQTLLHIWVCGICVFLILILILLNIEMLRGLTRKRSFALLQVMGMSKGQLRIHLAVKGFLASLSSCLMGHAGYFLYFAVKHIGTYRRFVAEFQYTGIFTELLKEQFTMSCLEAGWSLPVHLAFCAFGMACVFLLFFCPQNRVLKENIRESIS